MTNIPKKLELKYKDHKFLSDTSYEVPPTNKELMEKINELIDYLQEEASKGEHNCNDEVVCAKCRKVFSKEIGEHTCIELNPLEHEETKVGCDKCGGLPFKHEEWCGKPQLKQESPKEDEESLNGFNELLDSLGYIPVQPNQTMKEHEEKNREILQDYIRDNFVSKEKIKRELTSKLSYAWCKELFNSLGLGDIKI